MTRSCYATADTPRAIVALAAPFVFMIAFLLALTARGYSATDYPALIATGDLPWFPQVVGWFCVCVWIVRYFPPARTALWDGPCIISSDGQDLFLPNDHKISLASIRAVTIQRGGLRKVAYIDSDQGRIAVKLLFVRPSSDPLLRSLAPAAMAST